MNVVALLRHYFASKQPSNAQSERARSDRLSVEKLDQRDLPSVTSATLDSVGTLRIVCDSGADAVQIRQITETQTKGNAGTAITGALNSLLTTKIRVTDLTKATNNTFTFQASKVQNIRVELGAGNDNLNSTVAKPTYVFGDTGNDRITTGAKDDVINCGPGNDIVTSGLGNDTVFGEQDNDILMGEGGNDALLGGPGANVCIGGFGNDFFASDPSSTGSQFYGNEGNDTFSVFNRLDLVDGGVGADTATVLSGTTVRNTENVTISVPTDQPQNDSWSCGPNSASRFLRSYGVNASYNAVRSLTSENSLLSRFHFGTTPSTLLSVMKHFKSDVTMEKESNMQRVINLVKSGKPVIALVAIGTQGLGPLGKVGLMHYYTLNGFDEATQTFRYVDTNGAKKTITRADFDYQWKWFDHFTGIGGESAQLGLEALGLRKRTILF